MEYLNERLKAASIKQNRLKVIKALGWVFVFISLVVKPYFFGILGFAMGVAVRCNSRRGYSLMIFSILFAMTGMMLGKLINTFFSVFLKVMTIIY